MKSRSDALIRNFKPADGVFLSIVSKNACNLTIYTADGFGSQVLSYNELRRLRNCANQALIRMQFKEK